MAGQYRPRPFSAGAAGAKDAKLNERAAIRAEAFLARIKGEEEAAQIFLAGNPLFVRGCRVALALGGDWFIRYYDGEPQATEWINSRLIGLRSLFEHPEFKSRVIVENL